MEKKELKEQLGKLVEQIKGNSKDAHFAKNLVDELLSVKGQIDVEPLELDCGIKEKEFLGDTYRIVLTNKGVLYHEYGGYNIFVTPNNTALYESLADVVVNQEENAKLEDEHKENLRLMMSALGWVLQAPKIAMCDAELTMEIATLVIKYVNQKYEELMNQELQPETVTEDEEFKEATLALEELKDAANEA